MFSFLIENRGDLIVLLVLLYPNDAGNWYNGSKWIWFNRIIPCSCGSKPKLWCKKIFCHTCINAVLCQLTSIAFSEMMEFLRFFNDKCNNTMNS